MNRFMLALSVTALLPSLVCANDGVAGLTAGGIVFRKTDAIAMKKEVLNISYKLITVDYEFLNESSKDVEETIVFPLPPYPLLPWPIDSYYGQPRGFVIQVDGQPVSFTTRVVALMDKKDVTAQLRRIGVTDQQMVYNPTMEGVGNRDASRTVPRFTAAQNKALAKAGLIGTINDQYGPLWSAQVNYVWQQKFPAGKIVKVHHEYRPFPNGSIATKEFDVDLRKDYCADSAFFAAYNKLLKTKPEFAVKTLGYILQTGNTWKNGIEDFTMNLSKGAPGELISLCFPGKFRKINATTYQTRVKNFRPTRDLDVYFGDAVSDGADNSGVMPVLNQ